MRRELAREICDAAQGKTVLVVGDLMLDEYIWGGTDRISPEAPVPVVQWDGRTFAPGGAANVVHNVASLEAKALVCGVVGDDNSAQELRQALKGIGADTAGLVEVPGRLTTRKTRVFARSQQLLRVDRETTEPVPPGTAAALAERCLALLGSADAVLFSDYAKGALSDGWVHQVIAAARERKLLVAAGPKPDSVDMFRGATLVSFNLLEAEQASGRRITGGQSLTEVGRQLVERLDVQALVVTQGGKGATVFGRNGSSEHVPPKPVRLSDECGAGDTFLTAATLALLAGAGFHEAVAFANVAAASVVQRVGVCPATRDDLLELCSLE